MVKSLTQFTHDLRTCVWGASTGHPNWRETRFTLTGIHATVHRSTAGLNICISARWPKLHILNAYEMEADYLRRRKHA